MVDILLRGLPDEVPQAGAASTLARLQVCVWGGALRRM
jgi:hypothetical protein